MKSIKQKIEDFKTAWSDVLYLMKYFHLVKGGKVYMLIQVILTVLDSILPLFNLIIPGMIINELSMERINMQKIILYVSILVSVPLLNYLKERTLRISLNKKFRELHRLFQDELQSYIADMEYSYLEDPDISVQLNAIASNAPNAPLDMFQYIIRLIGALISILAISSIMIYLNPAVVIILLAIVLINAWGTKRINSANYDYQLKSRKLDNKYWIEFYNLTDEKTEKKYACSDQRTFLSIDIQR